MEAHGHRRKDRKQLLYNPNELLILAAPGKPKTVNDTHGLNDSMPVIAHVLGSTMVE